ncbi:MAG: ACP S-malonyltransferase [Ilumatobacteraceae bacterium]
MLAFTFPGQGSQRPGMGRAWQDHESWELIDEASEVAERDIGKLLCDADADELRDTRNAQLTTFVTSLMVLDAVERLGIEPSFCAGHSLGEYTALTATGALAFDEGVQLVTERALAMHDAGLANPGTMAAVLGLDDDQVDVACRRADEDVWVANYNAPGQVVIAGSPDGVAAASDHARSLGAKRVMPLPVAGAFHTPYMTPARQRLAIGHQGRRPARHRGPDRVQRRCPRPQRRRGLGEPPVGAALQPRAMEALPAHTRGRRCQRLRRARPWRPPDGHGATHRRRRPHGVGAEPRGPRQAHRLAQAHGVGCGAAHGPRANTSSPVERMIVSPGAGVFLREAGLSDSARIEVGALLGHVSGHEVRSPFAGLLQSFIAVDGERLAPRQPVAWLRTEAG